MPASISSYSQTENATAGLVADLSHSDAEQAEEKKAKQAVAEALSNALSSGPISNSHPISSSNVFSSRGILAQSQSEPEPGALGGRMPLVVGAIALVLAGVGAGVFYMHRGPDAVPAATSAVVSQPAASPASAPSNAPATAVAAEEKEQLPAQNVAVEQSPVGTGVSAIPAVVSNPVTSESKNESSLDQLDQKEARRADSAANSRAQTAPPAHRPSAIANLKMSSPSAPNRKAMDLGSGVAPLTDMAATQPVAAAPGLLTASGRTSGQPVAPPGAIPSVPLPAAAPVQAAAGKIVAPKLISSARLVYPPSARQTGIQGTVTVLATVEANGSVSSTKALNGPMLLRQAASDSVKQWKYSPGTVDGRPAATQVTVAVEFKLN
jgi:TonB family protein